MEPEPVHLQVFPLVMTVGQETEFVVEPECPEDRLPEGKYRCEVHAKAASGHSISVAAERGADGRVRVRLVAQAHGEISLSLIFPGGRRHHLGSVFAIEPGLAGLLPLRGDLHSHTWHSDGRSSPRELLRAAWACGLDFLAVTDHDNWRGSAEAVAVAEGLPILALAGEEVTFERGHLVALGTRGSVFERRADPGYAVELAAIEAELTAGGEPEAFARRYAKALWAARTIRAAGGLAILAHPFWVTEGEFHLDREVGRRLCLDGEVDAVELLGDVELEDNLLSVAMYMELLAAGLSLPVVGNSDTHGLDHTLGHYWTVVWARSCASGAILEAIGAGRCVACVQLPGERLRIYGPLGLVEYAYFLHRSYFPRQDQLHGAADADCGSAASAVDSYRMRCLGLPWPGLRPRDEC